MNAIDIRPGDVAWLMHRRYEGHVMLVVGVEHKEDRVLVVTIEGNMGSKLNTDVHHLTWKDGKLTGEIIGWGRPPALELFPRPPDTSDPAMQARIKQHEDEMKKNQRKKAETE